MRGIRRRRATHVALAAAAAGLALVARAGEPKPAPAAEAASTAAPALVQAEPPPFTEGIFPCSQCHAELPRNAERRELAFHEEQQSVLAHGPERWCLDCHDVANRDVLHLTSGAPVPFTESYRLCGQCHGDKLRDWRAGIHGKRVGRWDGAKTYFLCVNCHDPHAPAFRGVTAVTAGGKRTVGPSRALLRPESRPVRPEEQRR
ncbi:MAG TPA: cytochrome c3 family protein [Anaeromyxobacter sp.]|nr:cytochrome c3 family protein [Anaeromyxobacter sp.]